MCFPLIPCLCSFLTPQLLALTIQQEKPELESEKTRLLQQEEDKKIQLAQLEESLLEVREASRGAPPCVRSGFNRLTSRRIYSILLLLDVPFRKLVQLCANLEVE